MLHVVIPILEITVLLLFQFLEFALKDRARKNVGLKPSTLLSQPSVESVRYAEASQDLSAYHEVYQSIIRLRARLELTNNPSTFVEHAKIGRELNKLEKEFKSTIYPKMSDPEKQLHDQHARASGTPAVPNTTLMTPGALPDDGPSRARSAGFLGAIPEVKGYNRYLPAIKIVVLWISLHILVGWGPSIKNLPLFSLPAQMFWPFTNSKSKVMFPLSLLFNKYETPTPQGDMVQSLAFTTTVFVVNKSLSRLHTLVAATINGIKS